MKPTTIHFDAIGTSWSMTIHETINNKVGGRLLGDIERRIEVFDKTYSRFREDSWVSALGQQAGQHTLPPDAYDLLHFYEELYEATDGKVTPLIGRTIEATGYDASYSFKERALRRPPAWEKTVSYDDTSITLNQPALLDFGAAGKGYLVDIVGEMIEHAGISDYLINAGGDMRHRSTSSGGAIRVALENPYDTTEAVGIAELQNQSLAASAGTKRQWGTYNHIIDPVELASPGEIIAAWAIADDTMTADGLATALFFVEPAVLKKRFAFSYAVLYKDMQMQLSPDFPAEIFNVAQS